MAHLTGPRYRTFRRILGISIPLIILAGIACFLAYRRLPVVRLYETAANPESGTETQVTAIRELSRHSDGYSMILLLRLAMNPKLDALARSAAISALANHPDPLISAQLAELLQPHTALALRYEVARTISQADCSIECVRSILHYLERMWEGQPNLEDWMSQGSDPANALTEQQNQLIHQLKRTLIREREKTLSVLSDVYGLGSLDPSCFGIHIVDELHLSEACPGLERPYLDRLVKGQTLKELETAKQHLGCK